MQRKVVTWFGGLCVLVLLSGCGADVSVAHKIGMTEERWYALSAKKQRQLKKSYQKNQQAKKNLTHQTASETYRTVSLHIESGQARLVAGKNYEDFSPVQGEIAPNSCISMGLTESGKQVKERAKKVTELEVCYVHDRLYLDPNYHNNHYPLGTINIPVDDLLHQGVRLCGIQTQGAASLRNSCISARYSAPGAVAKMKVQPGQGKEGLLSLHEQEQKAKAKYWEEHSNKNKKPKKEDK